MKTSKLKILILIVLYKMEIIESETIQTLTPQLVERDLDINLIVWDNSPVEASIQSLNVAYDKLGQFTYLSTTENISLSVLYNKVVEQNDFDFILLLDQDSSIPENYIQHFYCEYQKNVDKYLFLPIVESNNRIVSPGSFWHFKGKHWTTPKYGVYSSNNVVALTSGMIISKEYFKKYNYKFDERLNLYGIDTKFMLDFSKNETHLVIMRILLKHSTTLWSNPPVEVMLGRFKNFRKAYSIILNDNIVNLCLTNLHTLYLSIKLALKYKDIRFLFLNK